VIPTTDELEALSTVVKATEGVRRVTQVPNVREDLRPRRAVLRAGVGGHGTEALVKGRRW
jgi:hypothetical protein